MPVGVIVDALSVLLGGLLGSVCSKQIDDAMKDKLNCVFGLCSMAIGISSIVSMQNLPAVALAMIVGTLLGHLLHIGQGIQRVCDSLQKRISSNAGNDRLLVTAMVLFCTSGTGIYGAVVSGVSGDHMILLSKAILDFFTAMIFACSLGKITAVISLPQFIILSIIFLASKQMGVMADESVIGDFKACGGIIMLATGLQITKIKNFPLADMIPSMILVWLFSNAWMIWVVPLL